MPESLEEFERFVETRRPWFLLNYGSWLPADRDVRILDFGFGAGEALRHLRDLGFHRLTGFDVDDRFVEWGRVVAPADIETAADGLDYLRDHPGCFDLILSFGSACYYDRREVPELFAAFATAMAPGGRLIVEVLNAAAGTGSWPWFNDLYLTTAFSEHSLRWAVDQGGLTLACLTEEQYVRSGIKRRVWLCARAASLQLRRLQFLAERGRDELNPTLFGRRLIAVADKPAEA